MLILCSLVVSINVASGMFISDGLALATTAVIAANTTLAYIRHL